MWQSIGFVFLLVLGTLAQAPWQLVWRDEFDGTSVNLTNWEYEVDCWGGGNGELQCYTARQDNSKIVGGNLVITAKQETYTGTLSGCTNNEGGTCTATRGYTSARIHSRAVNGASWLYGRWEIRAKLPNGKHLWPALWMVPSDNKYGSWAASGEIDIMEYRGQIPNKVEGTLHFGGSYPNNIFQGSGPFAFPVDFSQDFHVFAVEWEKDEVRWIVDDKLYYSMSLVRSFFSGKGANPYTTMRQPFDQRFHFVINLAVGGGFFPPATYGTLSPAEATQWTNSNFLVDYIRVYQRADAIGITNPDSLTNSTDYPAIPKQTQFADNVNASPSSSSKYMIIGGAVGGGVVLIAIAAAFLIVVVMIRRKSRATHSEITESGPPSMSSMPISNFQEFRPYVGMRCKAKFSGDNMFYDATVQQVVGNRYLVNYGAYFNFDTEWLDASSLAPM